MNLILMFFFLSLNLYASESRFPLELEKKCTNQVHGLKCGSPDGKNHEAFMRCVDKNILKLSKDCQEMHKTIRAEEHSHHGN